MKHLGSRVEDIKLAYVGGGSRGWAWGLMSDLAAAEDISGTVALYDIDKQAALDNVIIGNRFNSVPGGRSRWEYYACDTLEQVSGWGFGLTTVDSRIEDLQKRLEKSAKRVSGEEAVELTNTGEDGVNQIRALLGLQDLVTNVNLPNAGQIPNLPLGAVVETNAVFRDNAVTPCLAGEIPANIFPLISRIVAEQEVVAEACFKRDLELAFTAFASDPLVNINTQDSRALFDQMVKNTAAYLSEYLR